MSPNAGGGGELRGSANEHSCTVQKGPNKLWRSNSIFNLWQAALTITYKPRKSMTALPSGSVAFFTPVPEIIDPVFAKTSQNARFLLSENERFGHVFVKTGSKNSGTGSGSGESFS